MTLEFGSRRMIRYLQFVGFLLAVTGTAFAGGDPDDYPPEQVSGQSHWTHTINLEELEEGKHNLVIRAVDEAGNVRLEGPYDFQVDPETDIPLVVVAHPKSGDRVGRTLPIIGTARDDDGISRVEVKINDGPWRPASGQEAWSAILDAGSLGDGPQRMFVKSVDINGLESPVSEVDFIVDTSAPYGGVTDPLSGAVIAGKSAFAGFIEDPNGVKLLELSKDGGETWSELRFSKDRDTGSAAFEVKIDTKNMDDGPVVWWFRATDSQGSQAEVPFLFFIDNQGPDIVLELPSAGDGGFPAAPGDVFLAGTASDLSGVESISIVVGKGEAIDVPLEEGNPWWTWPLDLSGIKDRKADVSISAIDGAGNLSTIDVRIPLDPDADKPLLTVDDVERLSERYFYSGEVFFTGTFFDDDGIGTLQWKSGDFEGTIDVERVWRLDLEDISFGAVELELTPIDRFGTSGETTELSFRIAPEEPLLSLDTVVDNSRDAESDWTPGVIISAEGGSIYGSVISEVGKELRVTYIPTGGDESALALKTDPVDPTKRSFQIPVKRNDVPGPRNFILRASDGYGGESFLGSGFYVQAAAEEGAAAPDPRSGDEAINLPLPFLRESDGAAILRSGQPLQGWTNGASVRGASLQPESPFVRLRSQGNSFTIENVAPGLTEPLQIVLPDGSASKTLLILTDLEGPNFEIDAPNSGDWSSGSVEVQGTVVDAGGVASMFWSVDGGSAVPVELEERGDGRFVFDFDAELSGLPDGARILILSAADRAGNRSEHRLPLVLDTQAPRPLLVLPPAGEAIGARSTLIYEVPGDEILDEITLSVDGVNSVIADQASLYALSLGLAGYETLPETLMVGAVDRAGNRAELKPQVQYDPVSDKPLIQIQTPPEDSVVRGPTDLAGLVMDDDAIASVHWRIDGGEWKDLEGGFSFREPLPLNALEDGAHLVEAYAVDTAGNVGDVDGAWFHVTRREAVVNITAPDVAVTNRDLSTITGTASDANGIREIWVSFDNGNTYFLAEGATDFQKTYEESNEDSVELESPETEADDTTVTTDDSGEETIAAAELPESGDDDETVVDLGPVILDEEVEWSYSMDTEMLDDGVHTLLIKVIDGAGDVALLAGLLQVDNTPPILAVGDPEEGSVQTGSMVLEGRVIDESGLESFRAVIERGDDILLEYNDLVDGVFHLPFDFSEFEAGEVLLRVEAADLAGNSSAVSRSFIVEPGRRSVRGEITLPVEGGQQPPYFTLTGIVENVITGDEAYLLIDGVENGRLELDSRGRFHREFVPGDIDDGDHEFRVDVVSTDGERNEGDIRRFTYRSEGSWVLIDGYPPGMAVGNRPLLTGRSGYEIPPPASDDKDVEREYAKALRDNRPTRVEVSIDGGLSFEKAKGNADWEYRIETGRMQEGDLPILVRSLFPDGWVYTRTILRLDKTLPDLRLNESVADGSFNGELTVSGTAGDDRSLENVDISVRPGGAGRYEVPSFIQGLYFDSSVFGATLFNAGLGITFFDDNVKIQVQAGYSPDEVYNPQTGQMEPARVYGFAMGAKLLANVAYLPLGYWFGPKWEALSVSFSLGANFTYFSHFTADGSGGVMSAVVAQVELPKIDFVDRKFITYVAPYLEGQLWFFSSDVNTTPYLTGSIGVRLGLL